MPGKNILKIFTQDSYYHVYNRGVAKQNIFLDIDDYKTFLGYLKFYLTIEDKNDKTRPSRKLNNFYQKLNLLAYCLMSNHFHLFVFQKNKGTMTQFMKSLGTKYSMYFNKKYHRVGPIFQGRYKAVRINSEVQFIYLSKYIHRNPLDILPSGTDLDGYKYSSYQNYLRRFDQSWLDTSEILSYFSKIHSGETYKKFVEEVDETDLLRIKDLVLDLDY